MNVSLENLVMGFLPEIDMTDEQWVVHVTGADDIHDMPDELTALREANALNKLNWQQRERHEYDPICVAIAKPASEEWDYAGKEELK